MGVLEDRVAIVTGGGGGLGRGICTAYAKEGARVAIIDVNEPSAQAVVADLQALNFEALAISCDVGSADQITQAVAATVERFGTVDILVNNAQAASHDVAFEDLTDEDFDLALATGPIATARFMRACFPYLKGRGRIINMRSGAELAGLPNRGAYVAAKGAISALTKAAAREWGRHGITVNSMLPFVLHESAKEFFSVHPQELEKILGDLCIPRSGDAEADIGRVAVFLAGPDASFVTGSTVSVDGGGMSIG